MKSSRKTFVRECFNPSIDFSKNCRLTSFIALVLSDIKKYYGVFKFSPLLGNGTWSCHKVEQALWAYFVVSELNKELLNGMPESTPEVATENGGPQQESNSQNKNVSFLFFFF